MSWAAFICCRVTSAMATVAAECASAMCLSISRATLDESSWILSSLATCSSALRAASSCSRLASCASSLSSSLPLHSSSLLLSSSVLATTCNASTSRARSCFSEASSCARVAVLLCATATALVSSTFERHLIDSSTDSRRLSSVWSFNCSDRGDSLPPSGDAPPCTAPGEVSLER